LISPASYLDQGQAENDYFLFAASPCVSAIDGVES